MLRCPRSACPLEYEGHTLVALGENICTWSTYHGSGAVGGDGHGVAHLVPRSGHGARVGEVLLLVPLGSRGQRYAGRLVDDLAKQQQVGGVGKCGNRIVLGHVRAGDGVGYLRLVGCAELGLQRCGGGDLAFAETHGLALEAGYALFKLCKGLVVH